MRKGSSESRAPRAGNETSPVPAPERGEERLFADAAPVMLWVTDADGGTTFLSRAWHAFTGQSEERALGMGWLESVHPDDREDAGASFLEAFTQRRAVELEYRLQRSDGEYRWVIDAGTPRFGNAGEFLGFVGSVIDITERKRSEQLSAEQQRALELVASGRPTQECLEEVTRVVSRLANGVRACVLMATPARDAIAEVWSASLPASFTGALRGAQTIHSPMGSCAEVIRSGRIVVCTDIARDERWSPAWRDLCLTHGIRACQSTPVVDAAGQPSGSFFLCLNEVRELSDWERRLADFGAHLVSVVFARDRAAAALRRSEERLDVLSNTVPALISYVDAERRYVSCNAEYTKWFGLSADQIVGRHMRDVLGDEAWRVIGPRIDAALAGETVEYESETHYRHGGTRWIHAVYTPHFDELGAVVGVVVLVTDITARRQADMAKARLAAIVNSSDDAIIGKTLDGTITSWNEGAARLFGYSAAEALGRHITLLIPEDRRDEEVQILANMRRGESLRILETKRRRKDGTLVDVSLVVSPVVDDDGRVVGASKIARDITARLEIERQQRRNFDALNELVERAPFGIYIVDDQFRIVQMNAGSRSGTFVNVSPVIGRDFSAALHVLWPAAVASEIAASFRHTLDTGEPYHSRDFIQARQDTGVVESYEWDLHRITLPDGRYGVVCYAFDSTRLRHAEQALREADRRKDEFLATLAHELRNPLAPIRNSLHILRSDIDARAATRVHDMIERQVNHMVRLVDDLMEVSRITRGKIELRMEDVDVSAALHSAVETSRPLIETSRHQLTVMFPAEPLVIEGDPVRLAQIFANLLNNAAKYANPGSRIDLEARREGHHAIVSVRDTGIGIPAEMLDKVFDLFTQVDRTYDRAQSGLGIGLTLVRSLVTMHGGTVEARSDGPGRGSEFVVRLPLAQRHAGVAPAHPLPARSSIASALRILVVDDNIDAADSLALLLQSLGATVHTAHDGPTALYALETWKPTLIFLDIGLPVMDGFTVAQRVRATLHGRQVTLVALTGWGNEEDRRRSREVGIDVHLVKPVDFATLSQLLARLAPSGRSEALEFAAREAEQNGV